MILRLNDLKEMDIVRLRNGDLCWVLRNTFTGKLQTFSVKLWGQYELNNYKQDFKFKDSKKSEYDIIAVLRVKKWKALHIMRDYEAYIRDKTDNFYRETMKEHLALEDWTILL